MVLCVQTVKNALVPILISGEGPFKVADIKYFLPLTKVQSLLKNEWINQKRLVRERMKNV